MAASGRTSPLAPSLVLPVGRLRSITTSAASIPDRLADKVAIVTGASSGLGRAIALAFATQGTRLVVCADLKYDAATKEEAPTSEVIQQRYGMERALFVKTDVGVSEDMEACVAKAVKYGNGKLDM